MILKELLRRALAGCGVSRCDPGEVYIVEATGSDKISHELNRNVMSWNSRKIFREKRPISRTSVGPMS